MVLERLSYPHMTGETPTCYLQAAEKNDLKPSKLIQETGNSHKITNILPA